MKILHHALAILLLTLITCLANASYTEKSASGDFLAAQESYQAKTLVKWLSHQEKIERLPRTASGCCDAPNSNGVGRNDSLQGEVGDANFAQTSIRSDRTFSEDGQEIYSNLAGQPINTVDDLSAALRNGDINPADVPVDFVDINGTRLILNTRTSTALQDAGIPQSQWFGTSRTGQTAYTPPGGSAVTFDDLAIRQLDNNGLPPTGSPDLPTGQ